MRHKVFLDTSTLIASSILLTTKSIGMEIKDAFFDEATRLMSIIKKNVSKRIGVTTYIVEEEAYTVMSKAIERKLSQKISDRGKVFQLLSIASNSCEARLREILLFVVREPINPIEAAKFHVRVSIMYNDLEQQALELPKPASIMTDAAPSFLNKAEIFKIYKSQDERLTAQLTNLIYNPIEDSDKMILAQAAYLCRLYNATEGKIVFFFASTDHHFSPVRRWGLESAQVTEAIKKNFGITVDHPQEIFLALKEKYGA